MTTPVTWVRFFPLIVTWAPGAALVGENLFRVTEAVPVQKRGSVAGTRKVASTPPLDSSSDWTHGGVGDPAGQVGRKLAVAEPVASKHTFTPAVVGRPVTVSVTVTTASAAKPRSTGWRPEPDSRSGPAVRRWRC